MRHYISVSKFRASGTAFYNSRAEPKPFTERALAEPVALPHLCVDRLLTMVKTALSTVFELPLLNLRSLSIDNTQIIPSNQPQIQPYDPNYPNGDAMNAHIQKSSQRAPLRNLHLTGSWLTSPALFQGDAEFPYLEDIEIIGVPFTYDGRWYYTGDPITVESEYSQFLVDESVISDDDDLYLRT